MADVTERMLALLSTLQAGRSFSSDELTRRLGISPRTLRRDIDRLRRYGYPVDTQPGPGGYYRLAAGRTMPPVVLDDDEAIATLLALAHLASAGPATDGGIDDAATRAYGKLDQVLPKRLRPRVRSIRASLETSTQPTPAVSADHFGLIAESIARPEILSFSYTDAQGGQGQRRVEPYRQIHHLLRWYLLAWDLDRADWRVFRLDRMSDPLPTGRRFTPRPLPSGSAVTYLRQALNRSKYPVRLTVEAAADHVADALRYQDAEIESTDGQRTTVVLALDSWQWLLLNLAFLDADFTISANDELIRTCGTFARRLLAATSNPPQPSV